MYPRSITLKFFDHRTLFWSPNRQFQSNYPHCCWAGSTLAIIGDKIKKLLERTTLDKFYLFPKKRPRSMRLNFFNHQTLFWSPNRQFQSNSAFWLPGSTLARVVDKIKKMDWTNDFGQVLSISRKSIRVRSGLTFLIIEHCFGHQVVNLSRIKLLVGGQAPH